MCGGGGSLRDGCRPLEWNGGWGVFSGLVHLEDVQPMAVVVDVWVFWAPGGGVCVI